MNIKPLDGVLSISEQINAADIDAIKSVGYRSIICNRPDGEAPDQPRGVDIAAASSAAGLAFRHIPVVASSITDAQIAEFQKALSEMPGPILAYCRSGSRSATLWALSHAHETSAVELIARASSAGVDIAAVAPRLRERQTANGAGAPIWDVVIVGGGAAGIATAASLLRRRPSLKICVVEPAEKHYYQPGWTMVGAGVFTAAETCHSMASVMPAEVTWRKAAVVAFDPERNEVALSSGERERYRMLVVACGLTLDWSAIPGLSEALGKNGVTSNYRFDLAPYTWELVQKLQKGVALFTQAPMPIKCAGAPQKAMYLSADYWRSQGRLGDIAIHFHTAAPVLFGVKEFVPPLMEYVNRYGATLHTESRLVRVDGAARTAVFREKRADGTEADVSRQFDFLHVCPAQVSPEFVRTSALAAPSGWVDVDDATMQHKRFKNVFALGDVASTPNAKTAAAARKQAPIVATNLLAVLDGAAPTAAYDGYGSCPLTVERGKIVLAEFGYGGKLLPTFPKWLIDGQKPSSLAWMLKTKILPQVYWQGMLKGREWMCKPQEKSALH